jgi:quercetin dioxygenase-like cupin family protein|tara:strand:+ start:27 stop:491 length:465 start_codon:yes stop_codon:yes gene_type:complete
MTRFALLRWVCCALVVVGARPASAQGLTPDEHGFIVAAPGDMVPPEGSRSVRVLGTAGEPGMYVTRITFAAGTGTKPHSHDQGRYITVLKGTWWVALGPDASTYKPETMRPVPAGSFLYEPPHGIHYDQARDEAVTVQITGVGPVKTERYETAP